MMFLRQAISWSVFLGVCILRIQANTDDTCVDEYECDSGVTNPDVQSANELSQFWMFESTVDGELRPTMTFNLYYTEDDFEEVTINTKAPMFEHFNASNPTKIITHGWRNGKFSSVGQEIKDAYIRSGRNVNVIIVDWSEGSYRLYGRSQFCVKVAAQILADFVDRLVDEYKVELKDIHLLGHSLGAHLSGIAGQLVKSGRVGRVTGFDPARPMFETSDVPKISFKSADYVDVIHTSAGALGLKRRLGHVDYYPNEGDAPQPGCDADLTAECSHSRSFQIFAEALLKTEGFKATKCPSWKDFKEGLCKTGEIITIGENIPHKSSGGLYFLKTGTENGLLGKGDDSTFLTPAEKESDDLQSSTWAESLRTLDDK